MHRNAHEIMSLFTGWGKNYGIYKLTGEITEDGKHVGKAYSLAGDVSPNMWSDHLNGKQGLGIIPITDKSEVRFAAIDIDVYADLNPKALIKEIVAKKMPLVAVRSKSGGLHLYMFISDWAPAKLVQQKMREMAAILGHGEAEIFPKQVTILASRGDVGQWINMPYFNEQATERYAYGDQGQQLTLIEFLKLAVSKMLTPDEVAAIKYTNRETEPLQGGPPCLNILATRGFPPGTRNNGLLNLGIYAMKAHPDNWVKFIEEYNQKFMDPPLSSSEVQGVVKSLKKDKGYNYTCKQQPITAHCNLARCRGCKHGVGVMGVGMPKYGTLCKYDTSPPIWFVDVDGSGRLELSTEDLQYNRRYQTQCMAALSIMPPLVKADVWAEVVARLMEDVTVIEVPREATPKGLLWSYLEDFCLSRVQARTEKEILLGKPWTANGKHFFRLRDLMAFLTRMKFTELDMSHVAVYLKDWGAEKHFFNAGGRGVNCYVIKEFTPSTVNHDIPDDIKHPPPI